MWLARINANLVRESSREKLLRYQRECAKVLREYWKTLFSLSQLFVPAPPDLPQVARSPLAAYGEPREPSRQPGGDGFKELLAKMPRSLRPLLIRL